MTGVGMVLLFLLTLATRNRALYEQNFGWLVAINVAVAAFLLLVIVWLGVRLALRFKRGKFGSRLLIKLAAIIGLVGVLPGLLIYTVSYQFVSRSIESWFDVRVESALSAGLNLGRTTLDTLAADLGSKTRVAAEGLGRTPNSSAVLALERLREQLGVTDLVLWSASGQALGSSGLSRFDLTPERPSAAQLRSVRASRVVAQIEGLDEGADGELQAALAANQARIKVLALVSPPSFGFDSEPRFLQVVAPLPAALVADALAVQVANREYQERALAREGLRRMYIGTLTLALFLAVFGAVLLAVLLGNQLIRPLLVLAEGMREVATGDLSPKKSLTSRDELAGLTRTFALMTQDLSDARAAPRATTCRPSWTTSPPVWWCSTARAACKASTPALRASCAHHSTCTWASPWPPCPDWKRFRLRCCSSLNVSCPTRRRTKAATGSSLSNSAPTALRRSTRASP